MRTEDGVDVSLFNLPSSAGEPQQRRFFYFSNIRSCYSQPTSPQIRSSALGPRYLFLHLHPPFLLSMFRFSSFSYWFMHCCGCGCVWFPQHSYESAPTEAPIVCMMKCPFSSLNNNLPMFAPGSYFFSTFLPSKSNVLFLMSSCVSPFSLPPPPQKKSESLLLLFKGTEPEKEIAEWDSL